MASGTDPETRGLTASVLARLLERLDDDPDRSGEAYESLRRTLVKFFDWRGAPHPDLCADETLDRLARKLDEGARVDDPRSFAHGIARLVLFEQWRRPEARIPHADESALARVAAPTAPEPPEDMEREPCLARCLDDLAPDGRELILGYYAAEGGSLKIENRKRLAGLLGLTDNALRSRAQRIRDRLERCIVRCMRGGGAADTKT